MDDWPKIPKTPEDSTAWRIEVRLRALGWSQAHLGAVIAAQEGRPSPLTSATIRDRLSGRRGMDNFVPRAALALGVSEETLIPSERKSDAVRAQALLDLVTNIVGYSEQMKLRAAPPAP